jgi:Uma2 family endonuclease
MLARLLTAEQLGIRLEIVGGLPIWEASPVWRHQKAIDSIRATINPVNHADACSCVHAADVYVKFPDGSFKRPDISIFCQEPNEDDEAVSLLPEAVIEVLSKGYESKDLDVGVKFYLSQGVKDIIVVNPMTKSILHFVHGEMKQLISPSPIILQCGCACVV